MRVRAIANVNIGEITALPSAHLAFPNPSFKRSLASLLNGYHLTTRTMSYTRATVGLYALSIYELLLVLDDEYRLVLKSAEIHAALI
ncbi:hypothetical protein AX14_005934 [Amanita brunnescens Koide BX004]|nr:hypothetical protein AX14_005934 [Amanita brunnescens Koide BX004]